DEQPGYERLHKTHRFPWGFDRYRFAAVRTPAQSNAQERAANLRAQLVEAQARQAELQTRLQQLEENLKPENIERSLAGVGSVHPEELREARRRQLEIEKRGVRSEEHTSELQSLAY